MSKYFNSIVTCHRGRRLALRAFLRAFSLAVKHLDKDSFEIVITDMDESSDTLIDKYSDVLNINLCKVKYDGIFCRGRALNHAVLNAQGEYITPLDLDSIISKHFLLNIEKFYSEHDTERMKLCHRVRMLDSDTSLTFLFNNFDESAIDNLLINYKNFVMHVERYTGDAIGYKGGEISSEWLEGEALGNSQFTLLKSIFMELGGYGESFVGWGCEDMDFNLRAYRFLGGGYLEPDPRCNLYHLVNMNLSKNYRTTEIVEANYKKYCKNRENNIIFLPVSSRWGKF